MNSENLGQYVNVGTKRKHASWLDISRDGTSESEEHCFDEQITITPRVCENTGQIETYEDIRDGRNFGVKTRERRAYAKYAKPHIRGTVV